MVIIVASLETKVYKTSHRENGSFFDLIKEVFHFTSLLFSFLYFLNFNCSYAFNLASY